MTVSVMKTTFQKLKPRIVQYRDYAQFYNDNFRKKLLENLTLDNVNTNSKELLNSFFSNAVKNLKIPEFSDSNPLAENTPHPIFKAILKYKNHPSITAIKNARNGPGFYFCGVSVNVSKEIKRLKAKKATQITDIPVKILKEDAIFSAYICDFLNETIRSGKFPAILKNGEITAVFKKGFKASKENYRPVSILLII